MATLAGDEALKVLNDRWKELPERDHGFVQSIMDKANRRKGDSPKVWEWVVKKAEQILKRNQPDTRGTEQIGSLFRITDMFEIAKSRGIVKFPAMVLKLANGQLVRFSIAGERSSTPGAVVVRQPTKVGGEYYGKILTNGKWLGKGNEPAGLVDLMKEFAANPQATVVKFGRETGNCAFCMRPLSNPKSVALGYGPVCAKNWNCEWV